MTHEEAGNKYCIYAAVLCMIPVSILQAIASVCKWVSCLYMCLHIKIMDMVHLIVAKAACS